MELSSDIISTEEEWFIEPEVPTLKRTLRVTTQTPYGGPAAQAQVMGWGATCPSCGAAFGSDAFTLQACGEVQMGVNDYRTVYRTHCTCGYNGTQYANGLASGKGKCVGDFESEEITLYDFLQIKLNVITDLVWTDTWRAYIKSTGTTSGNGFSVAHTTGYAACEHYITVTDNNTTIANPASFASAVDKYDALVIESYDGLMRYEYPLKHCSTAIPIKFFAPWTGGVGVKVNDKERINGISFTHTLEGFSYSWYDTSRSSKVTDTWGESSTLYDSGLGKTVDVGVLTSTGLNWTTTNVYVPDSYYGVTWKEIATENSSIAGGTSDEPKAHGFQWSKAQNKWITITGTHVGCGVLNANYTIKVGTASPFQVRSGYGVKMYIANYIGSLTTKTLINEIDEDRYQWNSSHYPISDVFISGNLYYSFNVKAHKWHTSDPVGSDPYRFGRDGYDEWDRGYGWKSYGEFVPCKFALKYMYTGGTATAFPTSGYFSITKP